jgi:hypothetical protein
MVFTMVFTMFKPSCDILHHFAGVFRIASLPESQEEAQSEWHALGVRKLGPMAGRRGELAGKDSIEIETSWI